MDYKGTTGLYELLFYKHPKGYTKIDLDNYMDILKRTNVYIRNNDPNEQVQGSTDVKYLTIIKPYLMQKNIIKSGRYAAASSTKSTFKNIRPPQRPKTGSALMD